LRLVEESLTAGVSVAEFARQRNIHPNLIHAWRRQARTGALAVGQSEAKVRFAPFILPMSGRSWKSITAGIPILAARSSSGA
jgi:transposase-like protein